MVVVLINMKIKKSLLWQAVETKDWTKINKAKENLSKFRGKKYHREYD